MSILNLTKERSINYAAQKIIGKIFICIVIITMSALACLGSLCLILSIVLPELVSGEYIIHLAQRAFPLFTLLFIFALFVGVFIKKDKSLFQ